MPYNKPQCIIMILYDAFRPDYLTIYDLPHLLKLARDGVWVAECRSVFPSTTTANLTSFVTGAFPRSTGIPNNARYDREHDAIIGPLRDCAVPTITDYMHAIGYKCISVNYPTFGNPDFVTRKTGNIDTLIAELRADELLLLLYYNGQTDAVGHNHGPFSLAMAETTKHVDNEVGCLLEALDNKGMADKTLLVIASDHGMSPNTDMLIQPTLEETIHRVGLKVARQADAISDDTDLIWLQSGTAFLYWRQCRRTPQREALLKQALGKLTNVSILDEKAIHMLGSDPVALGDVAIVPDEGYCIVQGSGTGGLHGRSHEAHNMLMFYGAGTQSQRVVYRANIVDVVPTVLKIVGVGTDKAIDGHVQELVIESVSEESSVIGQDDTQTKQSSTALAFSLINSTSRQTDLFPVGTSSMSIYQVDLKTDVLVKSIEIEDGTIVYDVTPQCFTVKASDDGVHYRVVFEGNLAVVTGGNSYLCKFERPVACRFLIVATDLMVTESTYIRLWTDNEANDQRCG